MPLAAVISPSELEGSIPVFRFAFPQINLFALASVLPNQFVSFQKWIDCSD